MQQSEEKQKFKFAIMRAVIALLFLTSLGLFFFGLIKSKEAEMNYYAAAKLQDKLELCQKEAEQQRKIAIIAAEQARQAQRMAEEALQKAIKK